MNQKKKLAWSGQTCVSISSILCRVSRSSAWASASRSLTLISSSCSSLRVFFLGLSFQRPAVRAKWRWGGGVTVTCPACFALVPHRWCVWVRMCWCSPASALPGLWLAASAPSGPSEPPPLSASPLSALLEDAPRWCHLVVTCFSKEDMQQRYSDIAGLYKTM